MASSPVQICNAALLKLGAERINALTENNKRARLCNERYDGLRKEVLRAHPWNFAMARAELTQLGSTPEYGYDFEYQLPVDCLRVIDTENTGYRAGRIDAIQGVDPYITFSNSAGTNGNRYKIEGRKLLTDQTEVKIQYIQNLTDTTKFDPNFDEALSARIAADIAYPLVQSNTVMRTMYELYELAIKRARTQDGQEGSPDDLSPDFFLASRY